VEALAERVLQMEFDDQYTVVQRNLSSQVRRLSESRVLPQSCEPGNQAAAWSVKEVTPGLEGLATHGLHPRSRSNTNACVRGAWCRCGG
jgi:hypothetical protein